MIFSPKHLSLAFANTYEFQRLLLGQTPSDSGANMGTPSPGYNNDVVLVDLYDTLFTGTEELESILRLAGKGPGLLVEAACGTGRVLLPLSQRDWKCVGFDKDSRMLAKAHAKAEALLGAEVVNSGRLRLFHSDMTEQWPARDADLAIIAFNSVLLCPHRRLVPRVLKGAYDALARGGRLIVSIIRIDRGLEGQCSERMCQDPSGSVFVMRSSYRRKPDERKIVRTYRVHEEDGGEPRYYFAEWEALDLSAAELVEVGRRCGLHLSRAIEGSGWGTFTVGDGDPDRYLLEFRRQV